MVEQKIIHEDYIRQIRAVGESLIKNAESIVGSAKNLSGIDIDIYLTPNELPEIEATQRFYPDHYNES